LIPQYCSCTHFLSYGFDVKACISVQVVPSSRFYNCPDVEGGTRDRERYCLGIQFSVVNRLLALSRFTRTGIPVVGLRRYGSLDPYFLPRQAGLPSSQPFSSLQFILYSRPVALADLWSLPFLTPSFRPSFRLFLRSLLGGEERSNPLPTISPSLQLRL
jgi:hypothetical protein